MDIATAYCRVSTKNQKEALKDHKEQWAEIFEKEGYTFANSGVFYKKDGYKEPQRGLYIDEGISAKEYKKHRKAFKQMIADATKGKFNQILVEDTTRFARSVEDGMKIVKDLRMHGVDIFFRKENIHSSDISKDMFLSIYFTIAENEIKTDSNRLKWKQDRLHRAGKWTSIAPYGYNVEKGILSINEKEAPIIDLIFYLYIEKMLGMRAIGNYLNEREFRTKKGRLWKASAIRYILENRMYIGDIITHKTESLDITRGTFKKIPKEEQIVIHKEDLRIIENKVWNKKCEIMSERAERLKDREGYSTKHLLSCLLYCEECSSTFLRIKLKDNKKTTEKSEHSYGWTCLGHNHYGDIKCKGRYVLKEDELIDFIKKELRKKQKEDNKELLEKYIEKKKNRKKEINIEKLKKERNEINIQIINLRTEKNKKLIDNETYKEQLEYLNKELEKIRTLENEYNNLNTDIEIAEEKYRDFINLLNNLNFNQLDNATLRKIFKKIKIYGEMKDGNKYIYIHFSYRFLDETETEILREEIDGESSITEIFIPYKVEKIRKSTKTRYYK